MTRARSFGTGLAALAVLAICRHRPAGRAVPVRRFAAAAPHRQLAWRDLAALSSQDSGGLLLAISPRLLVARLAAVHRLRAGRGAGGDPRPPTAVPSPRRPAGRCGSPRCARCARVRRPSAITLSASAAAVSSQPFAIHPLSRARLRPSPARRVARVRCGPGHGQQAHYSPQRRLPVVDRAALPGRRRPVSGDCQPELRPRHGRRPALHEPRR